MARHLRHASPEATRAEASAFAREAHEPVLAAVLAREAQGPVREHSAPQVAAQLVHHETWHRIAGLAASPQERLEVLAHHAMQARLLRVARRGILAREAARRCRARRHTAPASKHRCGLRGPEPRRKRASAGGVAAAGGGLRQAPHHEPHSQHCAGAGRPHHRRPARARSPRLPLALLAGGHARACGAALSLADGSGRDAGATDPLGLSAQATYAPSAPDHSVGQLDDAARGIESSALRADVSTWKCTLSARSLPNLCTTVMLPVRFCARWRRPAMAGAWR